MRNKNAGNLGLVEGRRCFQSLLIAIGCFAVCEQTLFAQSTSDLLERIATQQLMGLMTGNDGKISEGEYLMFSAQARASIPSSMVRTSEEQTKYNDAQKAAQAAADLQRRQKIEAVREAENAELESRRPELVASALKSNMDAAAKGDPYGEFRMGQRYRDGDGVPKDLEKARGWFTKAAEHGDKEAIRRLAELPPAKAIIGGDDSAEKRAFEGQMKDAMSGDGLAQYLLGLRYLNGRGLETNRQLAIRWLQRAATNQGFPVSAARDRLALLTNRPPTTNGAPAEK